MAGANPFPASGKRRSVVGAAGKPKPAASRRARSVKIPAPFDGARAIEGITDLPAGVRLVLPWPPAGLNPNARHGHPAQRSPIAKRYRQECWALTLAAFGCRAPFTFLPPDGPIAVRLDLFPPNRRSRDDDNAESAFKYGRDGVAEALRIDDRRFVVTRVLRTEPRGCVVVTFTDGDQA